MSDLKIEVVLRYNKDVKPRSKGGFGNPGQGQVQKMQSIL